MDVGSSFLRVFGISPKIKILDFLLTERGLYDYPLTEIAENSGVSLVTTRRVVNRLLKEGIVKITRKVGKAEMFALDESSPFVQKIIAVDREITDFYVKKELEKQEKKAVGVEA